MPDGIYRMVQSKLWINTLRPQLKKDYATDIGKLDAEMAGDPRPMPKNDFIRGMVEEVRKHPFVPSPSLDWGLYSEPVCMLHAARGGVEYWDMQKAVFGSVMLDLNSEMPEDPQSYWTNKYIPNATSKGLKWTYWRHCHTYPEIMDLLTRFKVHPLKTGGLNLESIVWEGITPPRIAAMIDEVLGPKSILCIPTLGWMDGIDWSALSRHVFFVEFFLNDPPPNGEWDDIDDVDLARQIGYHAREHCGVKKLAYLCGISGGRRVVTPQRYLDVLKAANERFGGIYLGDAYSGTPEKYAEWA